MEIHPLADLFPEFPKQDFDELVKSIKKMGLLEPITTYEGKILDGRHRYRACLEAGVEPCFEQYTGEMPVGFVEAKNELRRHPTPMQRLDIAAELAKLPRGANQYRNQGGSAYRPTQTGTGKTYITEGEAARQLGVSSRSLRRVKRLEREAPELLEKVRAGEMRLTEADETVTGELPEDKRKRTHQSAERDQRLKQLKKLLNRSVLTPDIAKELGVAKAWVVKEAKRLGIERVEERIGFHKGTDHPDLVMDRVASSTSLSDSVIAAIRVGDLDHEMIPEWIDMLGENIDQLKRLKKKLQEELRNGQAT